MNLTKALVEFGLSDKQAAVYLATLSLGSSTVLQIARKSKIKRTTIYTIIDSLIEKELLNIEINGFKKKFFAQDPSKLEEILNKKKTDLNQLLPTLLSIQKLPEKESVLKYYQGLSSIKSLYKSLLISLNQNDDYYVIANNDYWYNLDSNFFQTFIEQRAKIAKEKNIKIKLLFQNSKLAKLHQHRQKDYNEMIKILPSKTTFYANLVITPKKLIIHQLKDKDIAIVIENQNIINTLKQIFDLLWSVL